MVVAEQVHNLLDIFQYNDDEKSLLMSEIKIIRR